MVIFGLRSSFVEYMPNSTIHEFAYGCNFRIVELVSMYGGFVKYCTHNTMLSIVVFVILGAGAFLCIRSTNIMNK